MLYHPAPLCQRVPLEGRVPMTTHEWLHTPTTHRSSGMQNPFLYMQEVTGNHTIVPVVLVEAEAIRVQEVAHG